MNIDKISVQNLMFQIQDALLEQINSKIHDLTKNQIKDIENIKLAIGTIQGLEKASDIIHEKWARLQNLEPEQLMKFRKN